MKMYIEFERIEGEPVKRFININNIEEGIKRYENIKSSLLKQNEENQKAGYIDGLAIECRLIAEDSKTVIAYDNLFKNYIKNIV